MELNRTSDTVDLLVVGAGPIGLACAVEARRAGLTARVVEKGALVNSILGYPAQMEFFSTPELLEIGGHPLATRRYKPLREEAIDYYRGVAFTEGLDLRLGERVTGIEGEAGAFTVATDRGVHTARAVALATGFFDQPNRLGVPGEDLPHVTQLLPRAVPVLRARRRRDRGQELGRPGRARRQPPRRARDARRPRARDLAERQVLAAPRPRQPHRRRRHHGPLRHDRRTHHARRTSTCARRRVRSPSPPTPFWRSSATSPTSPSSTPSAWRRRGPSARRSSNPDTMESTRPGVYLAGTVCGGLHTSRWFIENGRIHAARIAAHLAGRPAPLALVQGQP